MKKAKSQDSDYTAEVVGGDEQSPAATLCNFRKAFEARELFLKAAKDDVLFALGKQWDPKDVQALMDANVRPYTINQIAPVLRLIKGVESQNRSDLRAYPEGEEDALPAEIVSRLIKSVGKAADLDFVCSDALESACKAGVAYIEPWIEYPMKADRNGDVDMTGRLRFRTRSYNVFFPDPGSVEYDHSDGQRHFKFTKDLSKEQLKSLFPKMAKKIDELKSGKIVIDQIPLTLDGTGVSVQRLGYEEDDGADKPAWVPRNGFDLLDEYYWKWVERWYVVDAKSGKHKLMGSRKAAERFVEVATKGEPENRKSAILRMKMDRELWVCFVTGGLDEYLYHGPAWSFPRWDKFPVFPLYAYKAAEPLDPDERDLEIRGIVRDAKDPQREFNKRVTQEMRHLNQSTNSGWIISDDALTKDQLSYLKKMGGSPGVIVTYRAGKPQPQRIEPTPLSSGHAVLAESHARHMKATIGVNDEALAVENSDRSGRLAGLRIKQGMTQIQGLFDNYARTRRDIGRFIVAMLPNLFDVAKVKRILGEQFLQQNFQAPIMAPDGSLVIDPRTGQVATRYDEKLAEEMITRVLSDAEIGVFDVAVGEIVAATSAMYGQFQEALELRQQGIMVPDQVILESSSLPESAKKKTLAAIAAATAAPRPAKKVENQ